MGVMRDYPQVEVVHFPPDWRGDVHTFTVDATNLNHASREIRDQAEQEMRFWCLDQFGPEISDGEATGWHLSQWSCFTFSDSNQAMAFKLRWM